jgi:hypothetical protein
MLIVELSSIFCLFDQRREMTGFQRLLFIIKWHSNSETNAHNSSTAFEERFASDQVGGYLHGAAGEHHGQGMFCVVSAVPARFCHLNLNLT